MAEPNLYELLGVETSASQAEIKSAFRQQALRNHPDQGGNAALFHMIENAYETLVSPSRRAVYDRQNHFATSGAGSASGAQDEPTRANSTYSEDAEAPQDEPTRTWTADDWNESRWHGDEASSWTDREPYQPEPIYVREPDPFQLPAIPWWTTRAVLIAVAVWVGLALIFSWSAIPGVDDWTVFKVIVVGLIFWVAGPFLMRVGAWVTAGYTLWLAHGDRISAPEAVVALAVAFGVWFLGHWLHTFKTGEPRSFVAARMFETLPERAHPQHRFFGRDY